MTLPPVHAAARSPTRAFTLVEMLVAVTIGVLMLALALPALKEVKRSPIAQATKDFLEACREARNRAILQNRPMQIVIRDGGGEIAVEPAPEGVLGPTNGVSATPFRDRPEGAPARRADGARFPDGVSFRSVVVNQRSYMDAPACAVRFFPNGTADQFEGELDWEHREVRRLSIEVMTGMATAEDTR